MTKKNIGSSFDDFLKDESMLDDAEKVAAHRLTEWQVTQATEKEFFERGKEIARAADKGLPISPAVIFSTEDYDEKCLEKIPNKAEGSADHQRLDATACKTNGAAKPILP